MPKLRVQCFGISLDGYGAGERATHMILRRTS
jgi:hypothetical protein